VAGLKRIHNRIAGPFSGIHHCITKMVNALRIVTRHILQPLHTPLRTVHSTGLLLAGVSLAILSIITPLYGYTLSGSRISNYATVSYSPSSSPVTFESSNYAVDVVNDYMSYTPSISSDAANAASWKMTYYMLPVVISNNTSIDSLNIVPSSEIGVSYSIYVDMDGDAVINTNIDNNITSSGLLPIHATTGSYITNIFIGVLLDESLGTYTSVTSIITLNWQTWTEMSNVITLITTLTNVPVEITNSVTVTYLNDGIRTVYYDRDTRELSRNDITVRFSLGRAVTNGSVALHYDRLGSLDLLTNINAASVRCSRVDAVGSEWEAVIPVAAMGLDAEQQIMFSVYIFETNVATQLWGSGYFWYSTNNNVTVPWTFTLRDPQYPEGMPLIYPKIIHQNNNEVMNMVFELDTPTEVTLSVYDFLGEKVFDVLDAETLDAGMHGPYQWDGNNNSGYSVSPGMYFVHFRTSDGERHIHKILVSE